MSEFLKPQSPLKHKDGAYIYPLTTADQVILENGNRLNTALNDMSSKPKAGFIYPLASSAVPDGFLLCDGAEYSRAQYEELFAAIGTIYGEGDGSTTFNVPNLQTRVPVGAGNGYGLGAVGGEAAHTLTVDEMPSHTHGTNLYVYSNGTPSNTSTTNGYKTAALTESFSSYTNSTGGSQSHNNMQPYTVVNYIIATGKDTGVSVSDIVMGAQALPLGVEYGGTGATNAADALKNLGALSMELLWENASPTSDFEAQSISFQLNSGDVLFIRTMSWGQYRDFIIVVVEDERKLFLLGDFRDEAENRLCAISKTGIDFGDVIKTTHKNLVVPTQIYRVKGVSA